MRPIAQLLALLVIGLLLAACETQATRPTETGADCGRALEPGTQTRLAMIRKLMDEGRPHAALAHLDGEKIQGGQAQHLRAEILRRIGQSAEARQLYQALLTTCLAGLGHHGLGLLAGQEGRLATSVEHLRQARLALPTDARIRNDLGYALLLAGAPDEARRELLTAQELDPEDRRPTRNLLLLFYRQGDEAAAAALARHYGIDAQTAAALRAEAERLDIKEGEQR